MAQARPGSVWISPSSERRQVLLRNFQRLRNCGEVLALALARGAQILADGVKRRVGIVGNFAQMQAAAFQNAALLERQSRDLGHVS